MPKAIYTMVGMKHRGTTEIVASMCPGTPLKLVREPANAYDRNAVQVHARVNGEWAHVAFVKGTEASSLAPAMDRNNKPEIDAQYAVIGGWHGASAEELLP